jgi:hypothetical protein
MAFFRSPGKSQGFMAPSKVFYRWALLPYGIWTTQDGREILFNRFYEPIWQRTEGQPPTPADPAEWVTDIRSQKWFHEDAGSNRETVAKQAGIKALTDWGLPVPDKAEINQFRQERKLTAKLRRW